MDKLQKKVFNGYHEKKYYFKYWDRRKVDGDVNII